MIIFTVHHGRAYVFDTQAKKFEICSYIASILNQNVCFDRIIGQKSWINFVNFSLILLNEKGKIVNPRLKGRRILEKKAEKLQCWSNIH